MGISIFATYGPMYPFAIVMTLTCDSDACKSGLFRHDEHFIEGVAFIDKYHNAIASGWKDTFNAKGDRVFLCPLCSGK